MGVVIGVDGGDTTTHVAVATESGELLGVATGSASNWEEAGLEQAIGAVRDVVLEALGDGGASPSDVTAATFGLAGADWESDVARLQAVVAEIGLRGQWEIVNDAYVALRAGANAPWGAVIVAGSGAVAAGRNQRGEEFRTLGLGVMFGDFGSTWDIAEEAVRAVSEALTGMGPRTSLTDVLLGALGDGSVEAMLEHISREDLPLNELALPVLDAAERGDAVAQAIAERAGAGLGASAGVVARRLGMEGGPLEVVLAGSILRHPGRLVMSALERELRRSVPHAVTMRLEVPPVVGAVLRALEMLGATPRSPEHLRLSLDVMKNLDYTLI